MGATDACVEETHIGLEGTAMGQITVTQSGHSLGQTQVSITSKIGKGRQTPTHTATADTHRITYKWFVWCNQ